MRPGPGQTRRARRAIGLAFAAWLLGVSSAAADPRIVPLVRDHQVLVTYELAEGYTDQVRDAIASGLETTFTFQVELRLEVPAWVDRTIDSIVVAHSVKYDNLTRRYTVVRTLDGRINEQKTLEDEAAVRDWITSFRRLPLFRTSRLQNNREYYVRVHATARPSNGSMLWPFGSGVTALQKFTFIR